MRTENENSARDRIGKLAMSVGVNWETQGWVTVRELAFDAEPVAVDSSEDVIEGMNLEDFDILGIERGMDAGTNSECVALEKKMVKLGMWSLGRRRWVVQYNRRSECERGLENVDRKKRMIMKKNIYKLYGKLLKIHCLFLKYLNIYLFLGSISFDINYVELRIFVRRVYL